MIIALTGPVKTVQIFGPLSCALLGSRDNWFVRMGAGLDARKIRSVGFRNSDNSNTIFCAIYPHYGNLN